MDLFFCNIKVHLLIFHGIGIERFVEMRLSNILNNQNFNDTLELMFFHGTSTEHLSSFTTRGIGIPKAAKDKKKDFGQGFYLTTHFWQAKDYADRIAKFTNAEPLIIACIIPLGNLRKSAKRGLIIDEFHLDWLEIIIRGRFFSDANPLSKDFDWIYGRCGDGKTYKFERIYKKDEEQHLESLLPHIIPNEDNPHYEFDQLWLGTKEAINLIQSVEFINKEGVSYERIPIHQ